MTTAPQVASRSKAPPLRARSVRGTAGALLGLGTHLPERVVTNDDLAATGLDTSDAWIVERTGIRERRMAPPGTAAAELGEAAARRALRASGVATEALEPIIVSSTTPDGPMPPMACRIQERLGASGAMAMDLLAACSGFVYGLSVADTMIAAGQADTALIVGAEVMSRLMDWTDRSTCVLFGDAAGAAVVGRAQAGSGFLSWCLGADGRGRHLIGTGHDPRGPYAAGEASPTLFMRGPEVFKFATDILTRQARAITEVAGVGIEDVDLWVPHQANYRIIEAAARRLGVPAERVVVTVGQVGNTSSSSIPLSLHMASQEGRLRPGDLVGLLTMGAGLTWGSCLLRWS